MDSSFLAGVALNLVMLVMAIAVHEFAHAFVADRLGDDLPAREGRVTLNPIAHIDPIGTLLVPAVALILNIPLFGWGRPVMTNPINYTRKFSMRAGHAMVAFAGPFANLVMAVICGVLWIVLIRTNVIAWDSAFATLFIQMVGLNITLFALNLIPVPPLDGSKIVAWIFGYKADKALEAVENLGMIGLYAALLLSGSSIGWLANHAVMLVIRWT